VFVWCLSSIGLASATAAYRTQIGLVGKGRERGRLSTHLIALQHVHGLFFAAGRAEGWPGLGEMGMETSKIRPNQDKIK
jgi:hypothetical protein